jgi:DNA-directed RNA polymerase subunit RPC12/RpoP
MFFGCDTLLQANDSFSCPHCLSETGLRLVQESESESGSRIRRFYRCSRCGLGRIDYHPLETYDPAGQSEEDLQ